MKTFANFSDLRKQTAGQKIYIELSNGYYIPIQKSQLKPVADAMAKNEDKFCGEILEYSKALVKISLK